MVDMIAGRYGGWDGRGRWDDCKWIHVIMTRYDWVYSMVLLYTCDELVTAMNCDSPLCIASLEIAAAANVILHHARLTTVHQKSLRLESPSRLHKCTYMPRTAILHYTNHISIIRSGTIFENILRDRWESLTLPLRHHQRIGLPHAILLCSSKCLPSTCAIEVTDHKGSCRLYPISWTCISLLLRAISMIVAHSVYKEAFVSA